MAQIWLLKPNGPKMPLSVNVIIDHLVKLLHYHSTRERQRVVRGVCVPGVPSSWLVSADR